MSAAAVARPPFWRNVRVLRVAFQIAFLVAVVAFGTTVWSNLITNLRRQGISTDYDYLYEPAGFAILDTTFRSSQPVWQAILVGIRNTAVVALIGILLALLLGIVVGVMRLSRNWLINRAAAFYVESLRNVPVLVVIIFFNQAVILQLPPATEATVRAGFVLSNAGIGIPWLNTRGNITGFLLALAVGVVAAVLVWIWRTRRFDATGQPHHRVAWSLGVLSLVAVAGFLATGAPLTGSLPEVRGFRIGGGLRLGPQYVALLVALVAYTASHIAEIVRGSILAVPKGQGEAATALGLSEFQRLRLVVLPQAFRVMVPPLGNQFLNLTKNSSLAVAIGYPEVTKIATLVIGNGNPAPQSIAIIMLVYLMFSLGISAITNLVNRRLQVATR